MKLHVYETTVYEVEIDETKFIGGVAGAIEKTKNYVNQHVWWWHKSGWGNGPFAKPVKKIDRVIDRVHPLPEKSV